MENLRRRRRGTMIDIYDKIEMLHDLSDGKTLCDLNHGKGYSEEDRIAVDYVVLPMGMTATETVSDYLVIPVCKYCVESFYDGEWTLLLCKDCLESRWVWRKYSRMDYTNKETGLPYSIIIFEGCPSCTGEMEGVYYFQTNQFIGHDVK